MSDKLVSPSTQTLPVSIRDDENLPLLLAYREWLHNESVVLGCELFEPFYGKAANKVVPTKTGVDVFHFPSGKKWWEMPPASARASIVMVAAGVDLSTIRLSPNSIQTWRTILTGGAFKEREF